MFLQRLLAEIESILTVLVTLTDASDDQPLIKNQRISFSLLRPDHTCGFTDSRREYENMSILNHASRGSESG